MFNTFTVQMLNRIKSYQSYVPYMGHVKTILVVHDLHILWFISNFYFPVDLFLWTILCYEIHDNTVGLVR